MNQDKNEQAAHILILEDDPDMRGLLTEVLVLQGYRVTAVGSGLEAVEAASTTPFALIVTDIRMDGMDGLEALAQAKTHQPHVGAVVVSGYATPEETERATELGVGAYLKKPFRTKRFLEAIEAQLGKLASAGSIKAYSPLYLALWSLDNWVNLWAQNQNRVEITDVARLAGKLSEGYFEKELARLQIGLAAQLKAVGEDSGIQLPDWFFEDDSLAPVLHESLTDESSVAFQIAKLSAEAQLEEALMTPEDLSQTYPKDLLDRYRSIFSDETQLQEESSSEVSETIPSGLLALADTLARLGESEAARQALERVVGLAPQSSQAQKSRTKLLVLEKLEDEEFAESGKEMLAEIGDLSPTARAQAELQLGVEWMRRGDQEKAANLLELAADRFERLGRGAQEAVCRLALSKLGREESRLGKTVEALLHPSGFEQLTGYGEWMIPALTEAKLPPESLTPLIVRTPHTLAHYLANSRFSADGKTHLLEALEKSPVCPQVITDTLADDPDPSVRAHLRTITGKNEAPTNAMVRIYTLGRFRAFLGEEPIREKAWKTKKTMYLAAYLAWRAPDAVTEETLLAEFWPNSRSRGKKNLYWSISVARGCLRVESFFNPLLRQAGRISFHPEQTLWVDAGEFRRVMNELRQDEVKNRLELFGRLRELYQGPFLDGCYFEWAVRIREDMDRQASEAFTKLGDLLLEKEFYDESIESARLALQSNPALEPAHLTIMKAEMKKKRPIQALEQFELCRRLLKDQYGLEPNMDLVRAELEARMLQA